MAKYILLALTALILSVPRTAAAQGERPAPAADGLEASRAAVGAMDFERVLRDRPYATEILGHLDRLAAAPGIRPDIAASARSLRLFPLIGLERREEIGAILDDLIALRPAEPRPYAAPLFAAASIRDYARFAALVEAASRNVRGTGWAQLRTYLDRDAVWPVLHRLRADDKAAHVRMAEALFRIGWPGDGNIDGTDSLRAILVEDRIERGDNAGAVEFASGISTPARVLPMVVRLRYDSIFAPGEDRLTLLRRALDLRDRETAAALRAAPQDMRRLLDRTQFLRGLGRDEEALALLQPLTVDIRATVARDELGMWIVNEATYALIALGRGDEAVALMEGLAELPLAEFPDLISTRINRLEILWETGRYALALERAMQLESEGEGFASDFGKAWIASARVCALAHLDRAAEAAPQIERLRGFRSVNPAALSRAFFCLGDMAAAEALMIERLESEDPESAILALQDYTISRGAAQTGPLFDRLRTMRDRPAVRSALARVGRVLSLPLARTYWGDF